MHFTYKQSCDAVGYDHTLVAPTKKYKLIGYKDGVVIECQTESEWNKFKLREKIVTEESKVLWDAFWELQQSLEADAMNHFTNKLKEYFSELSPPQYELVYSKAYDASHSEGCDAVANKMEEFVEMCQEFVLGDVLR